MEFFTYWYLVGLVSHFIAAVTVDLESYKRQGFIVVDLLLILILAWLGPFATAILIFHSTIEVFRSKSWKEFLNIKLWGGK